MVTAKKSKVIAIDERDILHDDIDNYEEKPHNQDEVMNKMNLEVMSEVENEDNIPLSSAVFKKRNKTKPIKSNDNHTPKKRKSKLASMNMEDDGQTAVYGNQSSQKTETTKKAKISPISKTRKTSRSSSSLKESTSTTTVAISKTSASQKSNTKRKTSTTPRKRNSAIPKRASNVQNDPNANEKDNDISNDNNDSMIDNRSGDIIKQRGEICIPVTPEMILSVSKFQVTDILHKPSKWTEDQYKPLRLLLTMVLEDPELYNIPMTNTTNSDNHGRKGEDWFGGDSGCEYANHSLIRMEGTRRGKCNYVMIDPEDGEMVQCGNITRFRCKECSELAGKNRYYCIDVPNDDDENIMGQTRSCFHLHRTSQYCKLAQKARTI